MRHVSLFEAIEVESAFDPSLMADAVQHFAPPIPKEHAINKVTVPLPADLGNQAPENSSNFDIYLQAIAYGLAPVLGTRLYREFMKRKNLVQWAKEFAQSEIDRGVEVEQFTRDIMAVLEKSPEFQQLKSEVDQDNNQ